MKQKQTLITRLAGSHRSIASRLLLLTLLLFNFAGGAKAADTFTKSIVGHNNEAGRYYLIASPINGEMNPADVGMITDSSYDLYSFDPEAEDEWRNHKAGEFDKLEPGKGYLYANEGNEDGDVTLTFTGMPFEDDYYEITVHEGWNLLGNPFIENVYVSGDGGIYVMNDEGTGLVEANRAIKSMEGFFFYTEEEGAVVTLRKEEEGHDVTGGGDPEDIVLPEHGRDDNQNGIKEPEDEPTTQMQTIALTAGWNWVSFYVEITLDDLKFALVEAGTGTTIKSQDNITTYIGTRWRGSLNPLDLSQMYRIKVENACEITLEGMPIDPTEHPVTIYQGDNWIAFPLNEGMTVTNAFAGFAVNGDIIRSKTAFAVYTGGRWRGTLQNLTPGQGYVYESAINDDRIFVFPSY